MSDVIITFKELKRFVKDVFFKIGCSDEESEIISDTLVEADLKGVHSHGVMRLGIYPNRLKGGAVTKNANIHVVQESPATALIDGGNGMGQVVSYKAMQLALDKAKQTGVAMVGVRNSNHFGAAAYFTKMAPEQNMIGIIYTVSSVNVMAPWGSIDKLLGNNPISIGAPSGRKIPLILDMALSEVAVGKIKLAAMKGDASIPKNWALDKEGVPTTDPHEALEGLATPMAGYKGSGLAIMGAMIAGVLNGAAVGSKVGNIFKDTKEASNVGHTIIVVNIEQFTPLKEYLIHANTFIEELKFSRKAKNIDEILMPGEREYLLEQERRINGIPISSEIYHLLVDVASDWGVQLPETIK
jgi:LDH2 family malate/lactate/ureidoglycolate dehydrogenase